MRKRPTIRFCFPVRAMKAAALAGFRFHRVLQANGVEATLSMQHRSLRPVPGAGQERIIHASIFDLYAPERYRKERARRHC